MPDASRLGDSSLVSFIFVALARNEMDECVGRSRKMYYVLVFEM